LTVQASAGIPNPTPIMVGDETEVSLNAYVQDPPSTSYNCPDIQGPTWNWTIDDVEISTSDPNGPYSPLPSDSYSAVIDQLSTSDPSATLFFSCQQAGYVQITCSAHVNYYSPTCGRTWCGQCPVVVRVPCVTVSCNPNPIYVCQGGTKVVTVTVLPPGVVATLDTSNANIATVAGVNGQTVITGVGVGTCLLRAWINPQRYFYCNIYVVTLSITAAGDFIVPGSQLNAVQYSWSTGQAPDSVLMEVLDNSNTVVYSNSSLPTTYVQNQQYAEFRWQGLNNNGQPLTEAGSPYTIRLTGSFGNGAVSCRATTTARVSGWNMAIVINDKPLNTETLVTGPDEDTINNNTMTVAVGLDNQNPAQVNYTVTPNTASPDGPAGNQWGCQVTPTYTFYTTPSTPYNITYTVQIQQITTETNSGEGRIETTVLDGTKNPWDMDPTQAGRQTQGNWVFGISQTAQQPPTASRRGLVETYQ
jgi:hypothetical protein